MDSRGIIYRSMTTTDSVGLLGIVSDGWCGLDGVSTKNRRCQLIHRLLSLYLGLSRPYAEASPHSKL